MAPQVEVKSQVRWVFIIHLTFFFVYSSGIRRLSMSRPTIPWLAVSPSTSFWVRVKSVLSGRGIVTAQANVEVWYGNVYSNSVVETARTAGVPDACAGGAALRIVSSGRDGSAAVCRG